MQSNLRQNKYRAILKSSSLIGGAAFANIVIGMIRMKFVAVLLGASGVGLANIYSALLTPITTVSNLGMDSSGVRAIAEATGKDNAERVAQVVVTLRKTVWFSGILGCLVTVLFSSWLSFFTFQNADHTIPIAVLGITVLFASLALGQSCILLGTRKIIDVAKINVWSAINGTSVSIPCYYLWGANGIVPSIVASSFLAYIVTWWFARKVEIADVEFSSALLFAEAKKMLNFGLPMMGTALLSALTAYLLRLMIAGQFGLGGVGVWSAAFAISGILVNFVLNAMGADYYPRLTAVAFDNVLVEKEVNSQLEIALLMAAPALLVTILFAPIGVRVLYSADFEAAIPILRWSVYGIFGRVISWPLSLIMPAQGRGKLCFFAEFFAHIVHLFLVYLCGKFWGLAGTGIGFMILYVYYFLFMLITAHFISNTHLSLSNFKLAALVLLLLVSASLLSIAVENLIAYYVISLILCSFVIFKVYYKISYLTGVTLKTLLARF